MQKLLLLIFVISCIVTAEDEKLIEDYDAQTRQSTQHPLNPLTAKEIRLTSNIIKNALPGQQLIFSTILPLEPSKSTLQPMFQRQYDESNANTRAANSIPRKSITACFNAATGDAFEVVVNLSEESLELSRNLGVGVQPILTEYDFQVRKEVAFKDPRVVQRLAKLGLDPKNVFSLPTSVAGLDQLNPESPSHRAVQFYFGYRKFINDSEFSHPLDFYAVIDIIALKVIKVEDLPVYTNAATNPKPGLTKETLPDQSSNFDPNILGKNFYRKNINPIRVTSEGGPAFKLRGHQLSWQKFKFRIGFNIREGVTIHDVTYKDGSTVRPLIYRASISEMVVPYGDPRNPYQNKAPLDEGYFTLGATMNSIKPNGECLPDGRLLDVFINDYNGRPKRIKNAICIQEEDGGVLYKHNYGDKTTIARSRVLVIYTITTISNYEYSFSWRFHQDASIALEVGLTGLLSTNLNLQGKSPYASKMLPKVDAQYHQHIFNARIDTMFDGETNSVSVVDVVRAPDAVNPYGNGIITSETVFKTSGESVNDTNIVAGRTWKISNPNSINPVTGKPVAWKLVPMNRRLLLAKKGSHIWNIARFGKHAMWVTPYRDRELFAAGDYPYLSKGPDGLPKWVQRNESIDGTDIVIYHTFGVTHIPRLEDFPLMSFEKTGFTLKPCNFFTSFPGLDVPNTV